MFKKQSQVNITILIYYFMIFPKERDNQKKLQTAEQLFQKEWMKPREVSPDSRFLFYKIFTLFGSQYIQEGKKHDKAQATLMEHLKAM